MRSTALWRWVQDIRRKVGLGSRGQLDTTCGLYFLDAHAPHEHEIPGLEGGTKPPGWARCAGCAVGEEGAV